MKLTVLLLSACALAALALGCDNGGGNGTCVPTSAEICDDGVDNDCDGLVDEDCTDPPECTDGQRRGCGGSPAEMVCVQVCSGGYWGACSGGSAEICGNGIDDDCDNQVDEACECRPGEEQYCGGSASARICSRECLTNGTWTDCRPTGGNDGREICNDLDDDCDGTIDNAPGGCSCDDGEEQWCGATPEAHECQQVCEGGSWSDCEPTSGHDEDEQCGDGEDNDCDGDIDEAEPCTTPCGDGEARCEGSSRGDCVVPGAECEPGREETEECDSPSSDDCRRGIRSRSCGSDCEWDAWSSCGHFVGPEPSRDLGSCISNFFLGTDPTVTMSLNIDADETQWFSLTAVDDWGLTAEHIIVEIRDLPSDLDLWFYQYSCTGSHILSSTEWGTVPDRIDFEEEQCMSGCDDDGTYFIEISNVGTGSGCYTLEVDGLN